MWKAIVATSFLLAICLTRCEEVASVVAEGSTSSTSSSSLGITVPPAALPLSTSGDLDGLEADRLPENKEPSSTESVPIPTPSPSDKPSEQDEDPSSSSSARPQITYDQRQDGTYNIRADLENFMIIVIPPNPVAGAGLLDLLTQSALKRSNSKKPSKKHHKHSYSRNGSQQKSDSHKLSSYLQRIQQGQNFDTPVTRTGEFIEGRTPYSVDISSEVENIGTKLDSHAVDIVPPSPYPMQFQYDQPLIDVHEAPQIKLLELFRHFRDQRLGKAINYPSGGNNGRDILGNHVDSRNFDENSDEINEKDRITIHRGVDPYKVGGYVYVHLQNTAPLPLGEATNLGFPGKYETRSADSEFVNEKESELKLIGAVEQCGPGRRRNSYGICQFVPEI